MNTGAHRASRETKDGATCKNLNFSALSAKTHARKKGIGTPSNTYLWARLSTFKDGRGADITLDKGTIRRNNWAYLIIFVIYVKRAFFCNQARLCSLSHLEMTTF